MTPDPNSIASCRPVRFDRRSFLVTSLGAGFALAVQPVMAQTVIKTDAVGLLAGEVRVPVKDGEMVAYRAQPKTGGKAPVVLVVSEIFGAHEYIKDTCRRLAKQGYCAIGPELFARQGDPRQVFEHPGYSGQYHRQDAGCAGNERSRRLTSRGRRSRVPMSIVWRLPGSAGAGGSPGFTAPTIRRSRPALPGTGVWSVTVTK
jgi:hypothetical protein